MPTVQRHTERTSTSLKSGSITAAEASRIFAPHAISSAQLGTILGGTTDALAKVAGHSFGSAHMGTIIGGTIDADAKIAPHSFGTPQLGTIMPTEAETERMIAAKTIDRDALSYMTQSGSAQLGTTRYITFPVAFTDTPSVTLTPVGSTDMTALAGVEGSAYVYGLHDVVLGSFQAYATPTQYFMWIAQGSA